ncbi:MAG: DUF3299 domain-containing protein [Betaproteobacteria bacterium]|nr:DUF3299 domain-containing protein [Betaproteobacteria bacterium]
MTKTGLTILSACLISFPAAAQHVAPPGMDPNAPFKPLEERKDIVSWKTFAQVELVKQKDRYVPQFSSNVAALDRKDIKVQGFMMSLEMGEKQTHFVLSAMPSTCAFCLPGGPESLVEVQMKKPVKYTFDALVITGRLAVLKDDPSGIFYRLTDAEQAK